MTSNSPAKNSKKRSPSESFDSAPSAVEQEAIESHVKSSSGTDKTESKASSSSTMNDRPLKKIKRMESSDEIDSANSSIKAPIADSTDKSAQPSDQIKKKANDQKLFLRIDKSIMSNAISNGNRRKTTGGIPSSSASLASSSSKKKNVPSAEEKQKSLTEDSIAKPITYGSYSWILKPGEEAQNGHTHRWRVFVQGFKGEDISHWCKSVTFHLHDSFKSPKRVVHLPPFELEESGWGEFEILIELAFRDPKLKPVKMYHLLKLYPLDAVPGEQLIHPDAEPVLYERYDEILFMNPQSNLMQEIINQYEKSSDQYSKVNFQYSVLDGSAEEGELSAILNAKELIKKKIVEMSKSREELGFKVEKMKKELISIAPYDPTVQSLLEPKSSNTSNIARRQSFSTRSSIQSFP